MLKMHNFSILERPAVKTEEETVAFLFSKIKLNLKIPINQG